MLLDFAAEQGRSSPQALNRKTQEILVILLLISVAGCCFSVEFDACPAMADATAACEPPLWTDSGNEGSSTRKWRVMAAILDQVSAIVVKL